MSLKKRDIGLWLGPLVFFLVRLFFYPDNLSDEGNAVLAATLWIGIWWVTEAIPIAATSLLPLVLFPLSYSFSEFQLFSIENKYLVPGFFILTSILLISKLPTYSFKKIVVPRRLTIFLLFSLILFFGLLLIYTYNVIVLSTLIYLLLIPISFFHFRKLSKKFSHVNQDGEDQEDVL